MNLEEDYNAALDYLYSFVDYSLTRQLRYSPEKFNLDRMRVLMKQLGNPETNYPVVHIAGTKGKGSTSALIASVLQNAGYKVALYTSPHLHDYCERIQINRVPISHKELVRHVSELKPHLATIPEITTFEITTAIGFKYFAEQKVDIAIIEVGLGGRLDATNTVKPLVSVITSLSYDHMNILGDTIEKIAGEKGGIIKPDIPVIIASQGYPQVYPVLEKMAKKQHAPVTLVMDKYSYQSLSHDLEGQSFSIIDLTDKKIDLQGKKGMLFSLRLLGFHQIENAVTAYAVLKKLDDLKYHISLENIQNGFSTAFWPCRFEIVSKTPLIIIDSAHNADSAKKLRATVEDYLPGQKVDLIFGASEDKDIKGMFEQLFPVSDDIIVTKSIHPRAFEPEKLAEIAHQLHREVRITKTLEEAISLSRQKIPKEATLITGSIFVAAAAEEIINSQSQDKS